MVRQSAMPTCCAFGCTSRDSVECRTKGISFHKFPFSDSSRLWEWIYAVRGKEEAHKSWIPSASTTICSLHFKSKDFDATGQTVRLHKTSIPSIFPDITDLKYNMLKRKYDNSDGSIYCTEEHPKHIRKSVTTSPIVVSISCKKNSEPLKTKSKEKEIISNSEQKIADSLNDNPESPILNETESKIIEEENGILKNYLERQNDDRSNIIVLSEKEFKEITATSITPAKTENESKKILYPKDKIISEKSESAIKRKPNFSESELETLVSGVENKRDVLINHGILRPLDWKEITEEVNTLSSVQRTSKEVRVKWKHLRAKVKTKVAKGKHENFSAIEERIYSLTKFTTSDRKKGHLKSPPLEELQNSVDHFKKIDSNHLDVEIEKQGYPYEYEESFNEVSSPSPMTITPTEIQLLVKQQEQLLRQQGQILKVLEEFRDIQKEIFSLKQKNYEVKLKKFQITTKEDVDVEFATETENS